MPVIFRLTKVLLCILALISSLEGLCHQASTVQELEQLLEQAVQKKDYYRAAALSYEISTNYWDVRALDNAEKWAEKCITYSKKVGDLAYARQAHYRLGIIHTETKSYGKALDSFQKSVKLARDLKDAEALNEGLLYVATTYARMGRHKKSIEPLEQALSLAQQQSNWSLQQKCYELLREYYTTLGDGPKAREYKNLYDNELLKKEQESKNTQQLAQLEQKIKHVAVETHTVRSRLVQEAEKRKVTEDSLMSTKQFLEKTESSLQEAKEISENRRLEIDLLNKDKELANLRIQEQHARIEYESWIRNSTIAGILLASIMVGVTVKSYRTKLRDKHKIEKQNKNISSSINYAKRIQEAMLPADVVQKGLLPESFVLFKPRDSVSGDFFWLTELKNWYSPDVVFAAADCTGHGVPGAFMSLIGMNALNSIIARGIAETNQILDALDQEIRTSLQQETSGVRDGMDIALCIYRKEKNLIEFSGAKNSLVYIQNNELVQVKGDIHCIGGLKGKKEHVFKKHTISIDQPTTIYLFSDGYRDQFAEDNSGKFMSKRFNQLLMDIHQRPMEKQREVLNTTFEKWKGNGHQTDDVLVMGVKLEPLE